MEQYLTYGVNAKVQDYFAESLLKVLIEEGPKALDEKSKDDLTVRSNIMWSATMALNGLIGTGVPQDWSTHMIGHELTACHEIDHARTLSIVLPAVMKVCREKKQTKLVQYAENVWGLTSGSEEEKVTAAIEKTEAFFQQMLVPVRLSDVDLGEADIDQLVNNLEQHGMKALGEHGDITLEVSRKILQTAI
jgi:NADP-dependent alcohol dehydrogenase